MSKTINAAFCVQILIACGRQVVLVGLLYRERAFKSESVQIPQLHRGVAGGGHEISVETQRAKMQFVVRNTITSIEFDTLL